MTDMLLAYFLIENYAKYIIKNPVSIIYIWKYDKG